MKRKQLTYSPGGLFQRGALDVSAEFRRALTEAVRRSEYSREQVVEMIEVLTGVRVTKVFFDQSTSKKLEYRFPAEVLHAFCLITGSLEPFRVLLQAIGCEVIGPEEAKELKLLRLQRQKEAIEREIEELRRQG